MRAARGAAVRVYRRGPGPVHRRGRVLRRDGDAAGAAGKRGQEPTGPRSPGPGGAQGPAERRGQRWFGYTRIYANPDEPNHKKRHILREEINPAEAEAIRDAATRVLEHGESVGSIARDWAARGIGRWAGQWWPTSIVGTLTSPGWPGAGMAAQKYPHGVAGDHRHRHPEGWSGCSRTRRGVSTWCALRRICVQHRDLSSAAGGCITGGTREPGQLLRVRERPGQVRRDGDQGGIAGGVRDRRGAGRAGIPARTAALRAGEDQQAPRRADAGEIGTRRNGGRRPAGTTPAGSSTGPTGSISGSARRRDQRRAARIRPAHRISHRHERYSPVGAGP